MSTTFVSSGVTSSGLTETGANTLEVLNGGSATVTTLSGGGQLLVDSGGYAVGINRDDAEWRRPAPG